MNDDRVETFMQTVIVATIALQGSMVFRETLIGSSASVLEALHLSLMCTNFMLVLCLIEELPEDGPQ